MATTSDLAADPGDQAPAPSGPAEMPGDAIPPPGPAPEPTDPAAAEAAVPDQAAPGGGWQRPSDWTVAASPAVPHQAAPAGYPPAADPAPYPEEAEDEWSDEYDDGALLAAIFSAPSLALAGFVFALTGLLGGMIPESLPYLVQTDPSTGPAYHIRVIGLIALGFAIIAASLGLAAMLRAVGSPLRWPTYLGGAAVLLALLIAIQSVTLIWLAGNAPGPGG